VCTGLARLFGRVGNGFGLLLYHRISPVVPGFAPPTCNVTPDNFREQLAGLLRRGYEPWPLGRALDRAAAGRPIPPRAFVVTFDDGYETVYRHAWPVLRELNVPAAVFLATAYLGAEAPFPFDDWTGAGAAPPECWRPLTRAQCAEMQAGGLVELGCHTHTHQTFLGRAGELTADLAASAAVLRNEFGLTAPPFAFPFGVYDPAMVAAVRAAGLRCALTTAMDVVRPGADPFGWGRFNVEDGDTSAALCGYLGGWYSLFRRVGRPAASGGGRGA
jgi:peptidoglycan/xylan/chitin deacetylase (PgdA/CDA1 family)